MEEMIDIPVSGKIEFDVIAEYRQFMLEDETNDNYPEWTPGAVEKLLAVANEIIWVGTLTEGIVRVKLELTHREPDRDTGTWDKVNEATIIVRSGRLRIPDAMPLGLTVNLDPGLYKAKLYYGALGSVNHDGSSNEHFKIIMWREAPASLLLLQPLGSRRHIVH
jgi:hypothetical protein